MNMRGEEAEPFHPDQITQEAAGQQGEGTGDHTGADIQPLHDPAMPADVAARQEPERAEQAEKGDRHQQVDGREARDVGQPAAADE